jgi:integrase
VPINKNGRWVFKTDTYYAKIGGRLVSLAPDRTLAREMLSRYRLDALRVAKGLPPEIVAPKLVPLAELVQQWLDELASRGRSSKDLTTVEKRVGLLLKLDLKTVADLNKPELSETVEQGVEDLVAGDGVVIPPKQTTFTPAEVRHILGGVHPSAVAKLAAAKGVKGTGKGKARKFTRAEVITLTAHRGRGLSETTKSHYLATVTSFCKWLVRKNHLEKVAYFAKGKTTRETRPRRAITWEQCQKLAKAAGDSGKVRGGLKPLARSVLYRVAFNTMLRARALRGLLVGDLRLTGPSPQISVRAELDKTRRSRVVPLEPATAQDLAKLVKGRKPSQLVWEIPEKIVNVLRLDLADAEVPFRTSEGVLDLHSLRHSGASHLLAKGTSVALICKIGGWTDSKMLLARYGHLIPENFAETLKGVW